MALSPQALTTLDAVKAWLTIPIDDNSQNSLLEWLINSVSDEIANECSRSFRKADYETDISISSYSIFRAGFYIDNYKQPPKELVLDQYPVLAAAVTEIKSGLPITDFDRKPNGILFRKYRWDSDYHIQYTAGYVLPNDATDNDPRTLPFDIENAVVQLIAIAYNKIGSEHLTKEYIGPLRYEYIADRPSTIQSIIEKYTKTVIA